ncbi:MAG: AEC family transporter [Verrucomicrobiota bacterium]
MDGSFLGVLGVTLPVFLLVGLGIFLRGKALLGEESERSLLRVVVLVFYPALIFEAVAPSEIPLPVSLVTLSVSTGAISILLGFWVSWVFAPRFGLQEGSGRRAFSFATGVYNYGYLPIPLVIAFYGASDGTLATLFVFNAGVDLAFWSVGVLIIQGAFNRGSFKKLINPPLLGLIVGLGFHYSGLYGYLPGFVRVFLGYLATIAVPLGIILAGCSIGGLLRKDVFRSGWNVVYGACLVRLFILPILFLLVAVLLPLPSELSRVVLIQAAMPAGLFPVIVTAFYGGRKDVAVRVAVSTIVVSVLTTPLWISVAKFFYPGIL